MTRTAAEIGAGLAPARAARAIRAGERIHVIGVAGAGASAAALHAHWQGAIVTGCDSGGPSPYTPVLEAAGVPIDWRHDPAHVAGQDRLAVSKALTAVEPDHAELAAARAAGIDIEPWQQVVADAADGKRLAAVAGTHGKSTTAGWLTHVLASAGRDPSAFVGALLPSPLTGGPPATARRGSGDVFVIEADEYAGNWDAYRPDLAVITNVDFDHPDVFADLGQVIDAFRSWLARVHEAAIVANTADSGVQALLRDLPGRPGRTMTVGIGTPGTDIAGRVVSSDTDGTTISIGGLDRAETRIRVPLAGAHNAGNAVLVAGAASVLGLRADEIAAGIESFQGVGRRLERKGEAGGVAIYDDYGHHPTAIRATLAAVRQREPGRRVWVAHEPLTFHRTAALLEPLAEALAEADAVAVADIWPGRDSDRTVASPQGLADAVQGIAPSKVIAAPGDVDATADWLAKRVERGDVVLVMGGGHSYRIADRLLELLAAR